MCPCPSFLHHRLRCPQPWRLHRSGGLRAALLIGCSANLGSESFERIRWLNLTTRVDGALCIIAGTEIEGSRRKRWRPRPVVEVEEIGRCHLVSLQKCCPLCDPTCISSCCCFSPYLTLSSYSFPPLSPNSSKLLGEMLTSETEVTQSSCHRLLFFRARQSHSKSEVFRSVPKCGDNSLLQWL